MCIRVALVGRSLSRFILALIVKIAEMTSYPHLIIIIIHAELLAYPISNKAWLSCFGTLSKLPDES